MSLVSAGRRKMVKASIPKTGYASRLKAILDAPPEPTVVARPLQITERGEMPRDSSGREGKKSSRDKEVADARSKKRIADVSAEVPAVKDTSKALVPVDPKKRSHGSHREDEVRKSKKPRSSGRKECRDERRVAEEGPELSSRSACARLFRSIKNAPSDIVAMSQVSGGELYTDTASKFCSAIAAFNRYTDWAESYAGDRVTGELAELRAAFEKEKATADHLSAELLKLNDRTLAAEGRCAEIETELARAKEDAAQAKTSLEAEKRATRSVIHSHHQAVDQAKESVKEGLKGLLQERFGRVVRHLGDVKKSSELSSAYSVVAGTKEGFDMLRESGVEVPSELVETVSADMASALDKVNMFDIFDLEVGDLDVEHLIASYEAFEAEKERRDNPATPSIGDDDDVGNAALAALEETHQERDVEAVEKTGDPEDGGAGGSQ